MASTPAAHSVRTLVPNPAPFKKTRIFLSYASQDAAVAGVLERALEKLSKELKYELEVVLDVHSFTQGRSLRDEVINKLRSADVLFIIYTESLKKSHSWTGFEVGAFRVLMVQDVDDKDSTDRRIVSLYLDEMPAPEQDILGIKLNVRSLGNRQGPQRRVQLDQDRNLLKFFYDISDLVIERSFASREGQLSGHAATQMTTLKEETHTFIDGELIPFVEEELILALSGIVSSNSVEQKLFIVHWNAQASVDSDKPNILADAELTTEVGKNDVFGIFGITQAHNSMPWSEFKQALETHHPRHSTFIMNAIENAVRSGFNAGPVDNEQFFLSPDEKMYRIIVTRHYAYYDGTKYMHMYFIPMMSRHDRAKPVIIMAMLNVATRYRMIFLETEAELNLRKFESIVFDFDLFRENVKKFMRELFLIEDESHVYKLDDASRYFDFYADAKPEEVAEAFSVWKRRRNKLVTLANEIQNYEGGTDGEGELMRGWNEELKSFCEYVQPMNREWGTRAADLLGSWFSTGKLQASASSS